MSQLPSNDEIFERVSGIIVEALLVNPQSITPEARLFIDLGAESLDVLDIRFRIEQEFRFKIDQGEIIKSLGRELTNKEIEQKLTVESIVDFIKQRLQKDAEV